MSKPPCPMTNWVPLETSFVTTSWAAFAAKHPLYSPIAFGSKEKGTWASLKIVPPVKISPPSRTNLPMIWQLPLIIISPGCDVVVYIILPFLFSAL